MIIEQNASSHVIRILALVVKISHNEKIIGI